MVGSHIERTLDGPGVLTAHPRVLPLTGVLAPFERREMRVDVSRPVAVVLVAARVSREIAHLDGSKLVAGDRGDGFKVVALLEKTGKVSLFDGMRQDDEECDDGNRAGGDGCGPYCFKER